MCLLNMFSSSCMDVKNSVLVDDFWSLNWDPPKEMQIPKVLSRYGPSMDDDDSANNLFATHNWFGDEVEAIYVGCLMAKIDMVD